MKRLGLFASPLAAVLLFLALPTSASAGWAGSRYEKSDCRHGDNFLGLARPGLYCEAFFIGENEVFTDVLNVPDSTCASGARLIQRVQTVEVTWWGFDIYIGPAPIAQFNVAGDESPYSYRLLSTVNTDLGCAP